MAEEKLKRDIGVFAAGFLVLNGMIGAGIFGLPGKMADLAGMFSPWLFIIFGGLFITIVWTFASLASCFNNTGGPIVYVSEAFGKQIGFQTGWLLYIGRIASFAANINVLIDYAIYFIDGQAGFLIRSGLIFIIISCLTIINIIGIKKAVNAINIITFMKIIPLLVLVVLGLQYLSPDGFLPNDFPEISDLEASALLILYAFVGFEAAAVTAGETKDARKTLPKALIVTVLITTLLYFVVQLAYVSVAPEGNGAAPLVELGRHLMGPVGGMIIIATAIFSVLGNVTGILVACSRMTYAMSLDGSLPKWFSKVHDKYNTPANSLIFLGLAVFVLAISGTFVYLAVASALTRMIAYATCIAALPIIRKKMDQETLDKAVKLPFGYTIPIIAFVVCLMAIWQATVNSWLYFTGFVLLGLALYYLNSLLKKKAAN